MPRHQPRTDLAEIAHGKLRLHFHAGQWAAWESRKRWVLVLAGTQGGKALALDTAIPTPSGFVPMGQLSIGDAVFDEKGQPTTILYASPVMHGRPCYRLTFDDGSTVVADAEHRWVTQNARQRKNAARRQPQSEWSRDRPQCQPTPDQSVVTTQQVAESVFGYDGRCNHSIGLASPLVCSPSELAIDPYALGVWLGDGHSSAAVVTSADPEILARIRRDGEAVGSPKDWNAGAARCYRIGAVALEDRRCKASGRFTSGATFQGRLRAIGVLENKHIPKEYLFASFEQRMGLLQGLMDTDGTVAQDGRCEYTTALPRLAYDVLVLTRSLGIKSRVGPHSTGAMRITFTTTLPVCHLARKASRLPSIARPDTARRFIVRCEAVPSVPVRCIGVDSPSHQFLCTESFIPTHNTSWGPYWLWREIQLRGPGDYFVVTPTYPLLALKALPEFLRLFRETLNLGKFTASPSKVFRFSRQGSIRTFGTHARSQATSVYFGHASDPDSLESATVKAAWLDEAGQKKFRLGSWEAIQRRLSIHQGRALITTTPYDLGWLKRHLYDPWQAANGQHPDIEVVRFDSTENPAFPQAEFERARRELPPWKFNLFYRAIFTRPAGMIFDCFEEAKHVIDPFVIPATWPSWRAVGLDFGGVNTAAVFYAENPATRELIAYREYLAGSRTAAEHVKALRQGEPEELRAVGGAKSEDQWRREFGVAGLFVRPPSVAEVEPGLDRVYAAIKGGRVRVFRTLKNYLDQILSYSRVLDANGNPTEKIEAKESYHLMDAQRYALGWLCRPGSAWEPGAAENKREWPELPTGSGRGAGREPSVANAPAGVWEE